MFNAVIIKCLGDKLDIIMAMYEFLDIDVHIFQTSYL
jgi:hypothetical protein